MKSSRQLSRVLVYSVPLCIAVSCAATAAEPAKKSGMSMAEANQAMANPITEYTVFITENDTYKYQGEITDKARYQNITLIEPLIPTSIGDTVCGGTAQTLTDRKRGG